MDPSMLQQMMANMNEQALRSQLYAAAAAATAAGGSGHTTMAAPPPPAFSAITAESVAAAAHAAMLSTTSSSQPNMGSMKPPPLSTLNGAGHTHINGARASPPQSLSLPALVPLPPRSSAGAAAAAPFVAMPAPGLSFSLAPATAFSSAPSFSLAPTPTPAPTPLPVPPELAPLASPAPHGHVAHTRIRLRKVVGGGMQVAKIHCGLIPEPQPQPQQQAAVWQLPPELQTAASPPAPAPAPAPSPFKFSIPVRRDGTVAAAASASSSSAAAAVDSAPRTLSSISAAYAGKSTAATAAASSAQQQQPQSESSAPPTPSSRPERKTESDDEDDDEDGDDNKEEVHRMLDYSSSFSLTPAPAPKTSKPPAAAAAVGGAAAGGSGRAPRRQVEYRDDDYGFLDDSGESNSDSEDYAPEADPRPGAFGSGSSARNRRPPAALPTEKETSNPNTTQLARTLGRTPQNRSCVLSFNQHLQRVHCRTHDMHDLSYDEFIAQVPGWMMNARSVATGQLYQWPTIKSYLNCLSRVVRQFEPAEQWASLNLQSLPAVQAAAEEVRARGDGSVSLANQYERESMYNPRPTERSLPSSRRGGRGVASGELVNQYDSSSSEPSSPRHRDRDDAPAPVARKHLRLDQQQEMMLFSQLDSTHPEGLFRLNFLMFTKYLGIFNGDEHRLIHLSNLIEGVAKVKVRYQGGQESPAAAAVPAATETKAEGAEESVPMTDVAPAAAAAAAPTESATVAASDDGDSKSTSVVAPASAPADADMTPAAASAAIPAPSIAAAAAAAASETVPEVARDVPFVVVAPLDPSPDCVIRQVRFLAYRPKQPSRRPIAYMYERPWDGEYCPLRLWHAYLAHRPPMPTPGVPVKSDDGSTMLWLTCKKLLSPHDPEWYSRQSVGRKKAGNVLAELTSAVGLGSGYTNSSIAHCPQPALKLTHQQLDEFHKENKRCNYGVPSKEEHAKTMAEAMAAAATAAAAVAAAEAAANAEAAAAAAAEQQAAARNAPAPAIATATVVAPTPSASAAVAHPVTAAALPDAAALLSLLAQLGVALPGATASAVPAVAVSAPSYPSLLGNSLWSPEQPIHRSHTTQQFLATMSSMNQRLSAQIASSPGNSKSAAAVESLLRPRSVGVGVPAVGTFTPLVRFLVVVVCLTCKLRCACLRRLFLLPQLLDQKLLLLELTILIRNACRLLIQLQHVL